MKILEKIVPPDPNILAEKKVSITNIKNNEALLYNKVNKRWEPKNILATVPDGTYTIGLGAITNGTITITNGVITAIQEATN